MIKTSSISFPLEPMSWAQSLDAKTHMVVTALAGFQSSHTELKADLQFLPLEMPAPKGSKAPRCFKREWPCQKMSHVKAALSAFCTFPSLKTREILCCSGAKPLSGFPMALSGQAESQTICAGGRGLSPSLERHILPECKWWREKRIKSKSYLEWNPQTDLPFHCQGCALWNQGILL